MKSRFQNRPALLVTLALPLLALLALSGCSGRNPAELETAEGVDNPVVFSDEFLDGLDYAAFEYSFYDAFSIDQADRHAGTASLKFAIPAGNWAGGSFYSTGARDLSGYNALTFWAKASREFSVPAIGFGLGILYPSNYQGEVRGLTLTTDWTLITIPLPNSDRMTQEHGLFWLSAAAVDADVDLWFDEIEFASVSNVTYPRPAMSTTSVQALVGETFSFPGTRTIFSVSGEDMTVHHTHNHFDYFSSDAAVARADANIVTAVGLGEAVISAKLGDTDVEGSVTAMVVSEVTQPYVFIDALDTGLEYGSFGDGQYLEALSVDDAGGPDGSAALQITIPAGQFAGGAVYSTVGGRDLTSFNALVFDARSDQASYDLAEVGYGIGMSAGGVDYMASIAGVELSTDWSQVVVPIPDASRLTAEVGMFYYSTDQSGIVWIDNIRYTTLEAPELADPRPVMDIASVPADIEDTVEITGTMTTFAVDGVDVDVTHKATYFTYASSDTNVAVAADGIVTAVGGGTAVITATLDGVAVSGSVTVTVTAPPTPPTTAAPTPTDPAVDVISIYSDAYDDITVDTWVTTWSSPPTITAEDQLIDGDNVKAYAGFRNPASYCGINFGELIDATTAGMTHFHIDVYVSSGTAFGVKLVDFGANGVWGTDDSEHLLEFDADSTPPFTAGEWVSLDIPLTEFSTMNFGHVAQIVLTRIDSGSVWLDNIYFHK